MRSNGPQTLPAAPYAFEGLGFASDFDVFAGVVLLDDFELLSVEVEVIVDFEPLSLDDVALGEASFLAPAL